MDIHRRVFYLSALLLLFQHCTQKKDTGTATAGTNGTLDETKELSVREVLDFMMTTKGKLADSTQLFYPGPLNQFYKSEDDKQVWVKKSSFTPLADSLHRFIDQSMRYGLFPEDYHFAALKKIRTATSDSGKTGSSSKATLMAEADLLYSDAYMRLADHLKRGRLAKDSITLTADTTLADKFYTAWLHKALDGNQIKAVLEQLEPASKGYQSLKRALPAFVDSMDTRHYTYVVYPSKDSAQAVRTIMRRLQEGGVIASAPAKPDSGFFATAISKFQKAKGIKATGKMTADLAREMNTSDWYRFKRAAVTMDRFKSLPEKMPDTYVWVNLPGYYARVIEKDTLVMQTRVVVGRPANRTPVLNSEISNIVLYPTWSVPYSIASKEMLPIAMRNPGYFARRGFKVFTSKGKQVDPYSINWRKYSARNLPFRFRQNEGGGNALGVIKFNFENPYAVYLHDTNQRYLFERSSRALSHGCVRVQLWDSMARFLIARTRPYMPVYETINRDSITAAGDTITISKTTLKDSIHIVADSLKSVMAKKRNIALMMPKRIPIFIRYFSCEGVNGKLVFYEDVYNEDKVMIDRFFAKK
jgi:L,D-transpeptidase YcbB